MPQWIEDPVLGPVYVDENGQPADPADYQTDPFLESAPAAQPAPRELADPFPEPAREVVDPFAAPSFMATEGAPGASVSVAPEASGSGPAPAPLTDVQSRSTSVAGSQSVSGSGTSRADRQEAGNELDQRMAAHTQAAGQDYAAYSARLGGAYQAEADARAKSDALGVVKAQAEADLRAQLANLQAEQFAQEQAAERASQALQVQALADYRAQVAQVAAMPQTADGGFWQGLGNGGRAGMILAMFGEGFLGARGTNTNVSKNLGVAVDRMVDAQNRRLAQGEKVAAMYQQTWDMVRAQSATDAEARTRMRGLALAQAQTQILSELARFDAPMAAARAQEVQAAIQKEQAQVETELHKYVVGRLDDVRKVETQRYGQDLDARARNYATATSWRISEADRAWDREKTAMAQKPAFDPKEVEDFNERVIVDPLHPDGPRIVGTGRTKEDAQELRTKVGFTAAFTEALAEYRNMQQEVGAHYGGVWSNFVAGEGGKRVMAWRQDLITLMANARSGKVITDKEMERYEKMISDDTLTYSGEPEKVLNDLVIRTYNSFNKETGARAANLSPREQAMIDGGYVGQGLSYKFNEPRNIEAQVRNEPGAADSPIALHMKAARAPDANKREQSVSKAVARDWAGVADGAPPRWYVALHTMAQDADTPEERAEAIEHLETYKAEAKPTRGYNERAQAVDLLVSRLRSAELPPEGTELNVGEPVRTPAGGYGDEFNPYADYQVTMPQ